MRNLILAATVAVLSTGALATGANAMPIAGGLNTAAVDNATVQPVTYYYYGGYGHFRRHHHWHRWHHRHHRRWY